MQLIKWFSQNKIWSGIILAVASSICTVLPTYAAEKIYIIYGSLNLSLRVNSLETFANSGVVNQDLDFYVKALDLTEQQKNQLQKALIIRYKINPIHLSRFLNSPTGEELLEKIGVLISLPGGKNGKDLLRGALVQAALDTETGLTILNFLHYLATDVQLNTEDILLFLDHKERLDSATQEIVNDASQLSTQEIAKTPFDYSKIPDLRQHGEYGFKPVQILQLRDESRHRSFYVHIYQPQKWREGKTPVVVISHGLGSRPEEFTEIGKQLASYGFLVAIPQHPGSDYQQFEAMLMGYSNKLYEPEEFINRPLDVSFVLNELERLNEKKFQGKLDLNHVGVLGHSFGGYTALALAGATWDYENIKYYCNQKVWEANLSMLLQCDVLKLPEKEYNFRDNRVQAIGVMNPVNSVIFGNKGLSKVKIPVGIGAGTSDPATPAVIEQVRTLAWLDTPDKYFFLMVGQAHLLSPLKDNSEFSDLLNMAKDFKGLDLNLVTLFTNIQATVFLETFLAQDPKYRIFLEPGYWQYISDKNYPIYSLDHSAVKPLTNIYNHFKPADIPSIYPIDY